MIKVQAYAKINLTLEVLGKRPDGLHDIRSVVQTIALHDTLRLDRACEWSVSMEGLREWLPDNLILRAGHALENWIQRSVPTNVRCTKRIPVAAGLGGGSSDAAATLLGVSRLWGLRLRRSRLQQLGALIGADVPFFLSGGTAKMSGPGTEVMPVSSMPTHWVVLAVPRFSAVAKTAAMYAQLRPGLFTHGEHTDTLAETLRSGRPVTAARLFNVFEAVADQVFPDLTHIREALSSASGLEFRLSGAGPALFALSTTRATAFRALQALKELEVPGLVTRTVHTVPSARLVGPNLRGADDPMP